MKDLFLFTGLISNNHDWIFISHIIIVAMIILFFAFVATRSMRLVPRGAQNIIEAYLSGVKSMGNDTVGSENVRKYLPLIATIGFYVFVSNMIGIIPGFEAPSSNINMTLSLAIVVFFYYNFEGIRKNGFINYFKHFLGPNIWLSPLMFPVELLSHMSRLVSLSFRLFGNIKGDDLFLMVVLFLAPVLLPVLPFGILLFMGVLQTFIFMILTYVYISGAILIEEH